MIAINATPPWEPINVPTPNLADLEATVAAAELLAYQAKVYVTVTHAAKAQAYAEEARQVVAGLAEYAATALRADWQGERAMSSLAYHVERVSQLARQARRQLTTYHRARARLEAPAATPETEKGA